MQVFIATKNHNKLKELERILKRSNAFMLNRFKTEWIPLEDLHFKENRCRERADFILDTTAKF